MDRLKIQLLPAQDHFVFSARRYPAYIAGIGTGKTLSLLVKIHQHCEQYDNALALIVRKEFTDLRDSTIKDFQNYFGTEVNSHKEYKYPNGSTVMFRHGAELGHAVIKNINLSIFGIEQAEEFPDAEVFTFLRDRLRRPPKQQGCLIANANGHNWCWKLWKNNPGEEFDLAEATTFDNEQNLPAEFIADLKRMETDAPHHYRRYVLNSHEDMEADDLVHSYQTLQKATEIEIPESGIVKRILSFDVARYGDNETVFTIIESRGPMAWKQTLLETWKHRSTMETVGKVADLKKLMRPDIIVGDDDGVGGGVTDRLAELKIHIVQYHGGAKAKNERYINTRTESAFQAKELIEKGYLQLMADEVQRDQLMTLKFYYAKSEGVIALVSKERMRKDGIASPDRADALNMAVSQCNVVLAQKVNVNLPCDTVAAESPI